MNATTFATIVAVLLVVDLVLNLVFAWIERHSVRALAEALELVVPAMEDMRRIEPDLDESFELALIRITKLRPKLQRLANGYITPMGLVPRRKRRKR